MFQAEPDIASLAARAGVSDEAVVEAVTAGVVPLDREVPTADVELSRSENRADLDERLALLDDREREVVYLRFFVDRTQGEIAERLGISQMHVSRILRGALRDDAERRGVRDVSDFSRTPALPPCDSPAALPGKASAC